jgi:hypothetical protein
MRRWIIAGLLVTGCTNMPPPPGPAPEPPPASRTVNLLCDGEDRLVIVYGDRAATITDEAGNSVALVQSPSASGTLYEGGGVSLREHQGVILYLPANEEAQTCRPAE